MKRKLMLILLVALLAVGLVGVSAPAARADDTVYTEGTLYYTIANGSITITGCFGRDAEVHVPAMIAGIPVNTIASGAFANNEYVKTVYLPDTISKVGPGAFGEGVRVIYNANTDHPQDTPTDLILGLLTPAQPTEPPAQPTEPPAQPTEPPAQATQPPATATPEHGSGTAAFPDEGTPAPTATPKATAKPAAATQKPAAATATPAPTEIAGGVGEVTEDGTVVAEVEVEFGETEATPAPTEAPTPEPTEAPTAEPTQAPTAAPTEAPATAAPQATDAPTAAPEKTAEPEAPRSMVWVWVLLGLLAVCCAVVLVRMRKKKAD